MQCSSHLAYSYCTALQVSLGCSSRCQCDPFAVNNTLFRRNKRITVSVQTKQWVSCLEQRASETNSWFRVTRCATDLLIAVKSIRLRVPDASLESASLG